MPGWLFEIVKSGPVKTSSVAVAVVPVPPSTEVMGLVVLILVPSVPPVTASNVMIQEPPGVIVAPVSANDVGVTETGAKEQPSPVIVRPPVIDRPAGSGSVKATPVSVVVVFGLLTVNVRVVAPPSGIPPAPNDFVIVGGATTVSVAVAVPPVPPSADVTGLVVLTLTPAVVDVTGNEKKKFAPAGRVPDPVTKFAVTVMVKGPLKTKVLGDVVKPAGKESVNETPVNESPRFGLVMAIVRVVVAPSGTAAAPNAFVRRGGTMTLILAVLVEPGPLCTEEIGPAVLTLVPAVVPLMPTIMLQEPLAASVPPDKLMVPEPTVAVREPPHVLDVPAATTSPDGKESMKATPVSPVALFGFVMLNVTLVVPFSGMLAAPKDFVIVGGTTTMTLADAVLPVPPLVEVTEPLTFVFKPMVVLVTATVIVQDELTGIVPPDSEMVLEPGVAMAVPEQVLTKPVPTIRPDGKVSTKATPRAETALAAGFVMVKIRVVVPDSGTVDAVNDFAIAGGKTWPRTVNDVETISVATIPRTASTSFRICFSLPDAQQDGPILQSL